MRSFEECEKNHGPRRVYTRYTTHRDNPANALMLCYKAMLTAVQCREWVEIEIVRDHEDKIVKVVRSSL
jgi:hypothetical protein